MKPAKNSKRRFEHTKLLVIGEGHESRIGNLGDIVREFDGSEVLVVNRSGTLPASFHGRHVSSGKMIEIRLASYQGELHSWLAVTFGEGSWKVPTENRKQPPQLEPRQVIEIGHDLQAVVESVDVEFNRLIRIRFESESLVQRLYQYGRPIQYSYLEEDLEVWDQQTLFAGPPISVEPPSAGLNFSWRQIFELQKKGVEVVPIRHGAGLSSTGSELLDQKLPLAEWFSIGESSAGRINSAKKEGRKIFALGTTVARALESAIANGEVVAQGGLTTLRLGSDYKLQVVDGLITGMHEPGSSHLELLNSFCPRERTQRLYALAGKDGFLAHEYGDLAFLKCKCA